MNPTPLPNSATWAVVPVKPFAQAKTRLAPALCPHDRHRLAHAMFTHVLDTLHRSEPIAGVLVITQCPTITLFAQQRGARVLGDPAGQPGQCHALSTIVDAGLCHVARVHQAQQALVLMADLPTLGIDDVAAMLHPLHQGSVMVVAPDRHHKGTNALALRPPLGIPSCFGHDDSLVRHLMAAAAYGTPAAVVQTAGLGFDLDTPDDLCLLASTPQLLNAVGQPLADGLVPLLATSSP
ncbi:MAG: 2-phospho-L-lactate guanylyltransferase [Myxococcota bacterium]